MSLSIAIVGFPNVGKSTLFNALLQKQVALAANYPFATIDPNTGIVPVPDARLEILAKVVAGHNPIDHVELNQLPPLKPVTVEFVDVAGLVTGASRGEGLGNQFLTHIRETDSICHVLRAFSDGQVLREGAVSPVEDLVAIRTELMLADLDTLAKQKSPKGQRDKAFQERWHWVERFTATLDQQRSINQMVTDLSDQDALIATKVAKELGLLTVKPELVVINTDETELADQTTSLHRYANELRLEPDQIVIMSAQVESDLIELPMADRREYLEQLGVTQSGLERLALAGYRTLNLQSFLTAGEKEVRAWTITTGTTAQQAAGVIHSDFAKKFIKAQVVHFDDFVSLGGWKGAREQGKLRQEGKEYVMQPDDVVEFMVGS